MTGEVDERVTPLESLAADGAPEGADLDAWDHVVDGARVVGLGLAVPGSRECTTLAHRLLARLVTQHGVRRLALAAGESAVSLLDAHARPGSPARGDGAGLGDALRLLTPWSWATREMLAVIRWLAEHNATVEPGERVEVVGVDPSHPVTAVSVLGRFLRTADPDLLARVREPLADLVMARDTVSAPDLRGVADEIVTVLDRDATGLAAATSPGEHAEASRHAHHLRRSAELTAATREEGDGVRARLMAETVLDGDVPTALWGTAGHVLTRDEPVTVGTHLRAHLAEGYRAVLLTAGAGPVRALRRRRLLGPARRPSTTRLRDPAPGTLEATLGPHAALVDVRGLVAEPPIPRRDVDDLGSIAAPGPSGAGATVPVVPARELDVIAWVPRTRAVSDL